VVITDYGDGTTTSYEVDPEMAEQLLTIPTVVVEEKAKIGQGSNYRVPTSGESPSEIVQRRKRNTTHITLPADGLPSETAATASEVARRNPEAPKPKYPGMLFPGIGRFEDSRVSGAVKPSDAARIRAARKKRMYTSIMGRFAKSALTEEEKSFLAEALTDENARTVHLSTKVLRGLFGDLDNDDLDNEADRDLVQKMASYVVVAQQAIKELLLEHKAADELPELLAAMSEYKRVSESVIAGLLAEKAARDVESVEVDEVKDAPVSLSKAEIEAIVDRVTNRGSSVRQERNIRDGRVIMKTQSISFNVMPSVGGSNDAERSLFTITQRAHHNPGGFTMSDTNTIKSDEVDLSANVYARQGGGTLWTDAQNQGTIVEQPAAPPVSLSDRIADRIAAAIAKKLES
jgi:hypothetical protein